jgi:hypothetical protein
VCAPLRPASAKPVGTFEFLIADDGDQTDPSIDGQYVIYAGPGVDGSIDVLLYNILSGTKQVVAGGPGSQDAPDVAGTTAIYRDSPGISIVFWPADTPLRPPPPGGDGPVSAPAIGSAVAAWETGTAGSRDIRVSRWGEKVEYTLTAPPPAGGPPVGDQWAPAAFEDLVAYVDGHEGGSVWVHDSVSPLQKPALVCEGQATGVSIGKDEAGPLVAVARSAPGHDDDIEVYALDGTPLAALPVPGLQRNPHLSGPWVAFEDVSTRYSQVVVWNWRSDLVFVPHPSTTDQTLNDLSLVESEEVRVVFEDSASPATGRDIALYVLDVFPAIVFDDQPNGYPFEQPPEPASCDDPPGAVTVLATLHLAREEGKPLASEVAFEAPPPAGASYLPVLLCLDADRVSSAWVTLDDEAIARPSDFNPGVVHLESFGRVEGGAGRISGIIAGKPGATLDVRVLADPARLPATAPAKGVAAAEPISAARPAVHGGGGCGSAGGAGGLAALGLLLGRRRLRRDSRTLV